MKELFVRNVNKFNSDWNTLGETHPLEGRIHILQQILPYLILGITDPARDAVNSSLNCRCSTHQYHGGGIANLNEIQLGLLQIGFDPKRIAVDDRQDGFSSVSEVSLVDQFANTRPSRVHGVNI